MPQIWHEDSTWPTETYWILAHLNLFQNGRFFQDGGHTAEKMSSLSGKETSNNLYINMN